ncbi:MAG: CBS domain-containing protein [Bdellovibrionota bacterium]|nr:CBS domain-containing protein [Bdellovibrionota bacterium]
MSEVIELLEYTVNELGDISNPKYVLETDPVSKAIELMKENHIGSCLVIDENVKLKGIFTERDVLNKVVNHDESLTQEIRHYMTQNPQTIQANDSVVIALSMMTHGKFRNLPVVNMEGRAVGAISISDIMLFFTNHLKDD